MFQLKVQKDEGEREETQLEYKRLTMENNELNLRVQVLEAQLEEKAHIESLFVQVKDELSRNREKTKEDREKNKMAILEKEEEVQDLKVVLREIRGECGKLEDKLSSSQKEVNKFKAVLSEEGHKLRKGQTREAHLLKENQEQRIKLEECQEEVELIQR